jgi:phage FluMu protein Com
MPIRFRCAYCNRLLGIATRKAGTETTCPHCGYTITVPVPQEENGRTERINVEDVEELLGNAATEAVPQSVAAAAAAPAQPSPPAAERPRLDPPKPPVPVYPKPAVSPPPAPVASPPPPAPKVRPAPPVPKPPARPSSSDDPPLFEGDVDAILGTTKPPEEPERAKPPAVSGLDAMSLGEPGRHIVISAQKATFLMLLVVVLMALSFAAGMFLKG